MRLILVKFILLISVGVWAQSGTIPPGPNIGNGDPVWDFDDKSTKDIEVMLYDFFIQLAIRQRACGENNPVYQNNIISVWTLHMHMDMMKEQPCLVCKHVPGTVDHSKQLECYFKSEGFARETLELINDPRFDQAVLPSVDKQNKPEASTTTTNIKEFYNKLIQDINFKVENDLLIKEK